MLGLPAPLALQWSESWQLRLDLADYQLSLF